MSTYSEWRRSQLNSEECQHQERVEAALYRRLKGLPDTGIFAGCDLMALAIVAMKRGVRVRSRLGPLQLANTESDLLINTANVAMKIVIEQIAKFPKSADRIAKRASFKSFKPVKTVFSVGFPALEKVTESGEVVYGTLSEGGGETIALAPYASIVGISNRLFVNDDTEAIHAHMLAAGDRVASNRNSLLWSLIRSGASFVGPTCADGNAYFSTAHANLCTASALDATSLGIAVGKLRKQKSLDLTDLGIAPRFLVVGPDAEVAAAKLLRDVGDQIALELLIEPAIGDLSFYIFADPGLHPAFIMGSLNDEPPSIVARNSFAFDSIELRLIDFVGIGIGDFRAAVRTPAV